MKILTADEGGRYNGYVIPIWNALELPQLRPEQVYLTAVAPHSRKGPHLHKKRRGVYCCVRGNVRIVTRGWRWSGLAVKYTEHFLGDQFRCGDLLIIPPGTPAAIYNDTDEEALLLNMPSPAWSKDDPDEWPVNNWFD